MPYVPKDPQTLKPMEERSGERAKQVSMVCAIIGIFYVWGVILGPIAIWQAGKAESHGVKATPWKIIGWMEVVFYGFIILWFLSQLGNS